MSALLFDEQGGQARNTVQQKYGVLQGHSALRHPPELQHEVWLSPVRFSKSPAQASVHHLIAWKVFALIKQSFRLFKKCFEYVNNGRTALQTGGLFVKNRLLWAGICPAFIGGRKASPWESLEMEELMGKVPLEYAKPGKGTFSISVYPSLRHINPAGRYMQTVWKRMDLPSDPPEISKEVSLSRVSFYLFWPSTEAAPSAGKWLIEKTSH